MLGVVPSPPFGDSPLTVPPSIDPTPEPTNPIPERNVWVELRHATTKQKNYKEFYLRLRKIVAEHTEGSKKFYYALLGDDKYHKVRASDASSNH